MSGLSIFMRRLQRLDAYPKLKEDYREKTLSGAAISIIAGVFMLVLFMSEFSSFLALDTQHQLIVDTGRGGSLRINMNITFRSMPCNVLSLDAMDISGEHQLDVLHTIFKRRLDENGAPKAAAERDDNIHSNKSSVRAQVKKIKDGKAGKTSDTGHDHGDDENSAAVVPVDGEKECGSCYGAETVSGQCCNTCDEVREAYRSKGWAFAFAMHIVQCQKEGFLAQLDEQKGEGCEVAGHLIVNKVAGNFHFAPGKSFQQGGMHVHDLMPFNLARYNISHTINSLSFGDYFPGRVNPLDDVSYASAFESAMYVRTRCLRLLFCNSMNMYQYFLKVVPTTFQSAAGRIETNQFSVTEHVRRLDGITSRGLPGVFFFYDISPIKVVVSEAAKPFLHFLTQLCAIIGGVFTVAGIVDAVVHKGGAFACGITPTLACFSLHALHLLFFPVCCLSVFLFISCSISGTKFAKARMGKLS